MRNLLESGHGGQNAKTQCQHQVALEMEERLKRHGGLQPECFTRSPKVTTISGTRSSNDGNREQPRQLHAERGNLSAIHSMSS